MMKKSFHLSTEITIFFKQLHISKPGDLLAVCVVFMVVTIIYEILKCIRVRVAEQDDRWNGIPCFSGKHILQTFLFVLELTIGYVLMLVVMTFNGWLFMAILLGSGVGYHTCQLVHGHRYLVVQRHPKKTTTNNADVNANNGNKTHSSSYRPLHKQKVDIELVSSV